MLFRSDAISDCFVSLDYIGESARIYAVKDGKRMLLLDNFFVGESYPWEIGLKRFVDQNIDFADLELEITPLEKNAKIYIEKWPEIEGNNIAVLNSVSYEYEWSYEL